MKYIRMILAAVLAVSCCAMFAGCGAEQGAPSVDPYKTVGTVTSVTATHYAAIDIQNYGTIVVALDEVTAPITAKNFISLAEDGFYDGLSFHRIMEGFMMQGGGPLGNGTGGSNNEIKGEFASNGIANPLSHVRGAISMARSGDPNSASSQFFIVHEDSTFLDGEYAVFGYVVEGIEVVDAVCASAHPTDSNGSIAVSQQPIINSITIHSEAPAVDNGTVTTASNPYNTVGTVTSVTPTHYADIVIESYGTITLALDAKTAPITTQNFVSLAQSGFYDGLTFHRIMDGFMMQGGDPSGNGTGGSENKITGEFAANGIENPLSHVRGAISMARSNDPNSASSQFFIVHKDSAFLNGNYAVFGYVVEGIEVVDMVCTAATPTDDNGTIPAAEQPVIRSVTVREA